MSYIGQIIIPLIMVHLATIISFYTLKRINISEKFRSSTQHPANMGNTALQVGGLVIIPIVMLTVFLIMYYVNNVPIDIQLIVYLPVIMLFIVGLIDDFHPISAYIRLLIHFANATTIIIVIYQLTQFSGLPLVTDLFGYVVSGILMILAISWMLNTTNFIDGMDLFLAANIIPGITFFALLYFFTSTDFTLSLVFIVLLSSLLGFVWFNWPKASIYMGDSGTLCIGFALGTCGAYILAKYGSIAGFIPFTYMLVDTTVTLIIRIGNGQNPVKSHSQHAYQLAVKNGLSEITIRASCFIGSFINTFLAYLCFAYDHEIAMQIIFVSIAILLSLSIFLYFRSAVKKEPKSVTQT